MIGWIYEILNFAIHTESLHITYVCLYFTYIGIHRLLMIRIRSAKNQCFLRKARKILSFLSCIVISNYCQPKALNSPQWSKEQNYSLDYQARFLLQVQLGNQESLFVYLPSTCPLFPSMHKKLFSLSKSYTPKIILAKVLSPVFIYCQVHSDSL